MNEINGRDDQRLIDWTGERCVPWADDLQVVYEHYHRYAVAARFARGKRVLDLACGEGYGAAVLATEASEVVGVDLDENTVEHATRHYGSRNVSFRAGSITDLSVLHGEQFDVVVCFEAIEHVADHDAVLNLVRSRLTNGGLFIVSTPDTAIYQHEHGNDNPFHVKELSRPQFESLLEDSFRHVAVLKQNVAVGSVIAPADPGDLDTAIDGVKLQTLRQDDTGAWNVDQGVPHTYLLGLASNRQIPKLPAAAVLVDADLKLIRQGTSGGSEVVEQRDAAVADVARINDLYQRSRSEAEELKSAIERLESLRRQEEQRAENAVGDQAQLRADLDRLAVQLRNAHQAGERDGARIEWLRGTVAALESRVSHAEQRAGELAVDNAELAAQNSALVQRAVGKYRRVVERVAPRGTALRDVYELALGRSAGVVAASDESGETGPVSVPRSDKPVVSVIVPVHGKWAYTRQCLRFLGGHIVSVPFEVIVVDDASPDDSAARLAACEGVRVVRAEQNLGFIGACNLGAQHARGQHLFFLNNDAEVGQSWLDILASTMESDDRIGLVGAKLVYPDGRLQECGGIVWSDGSGWNLGRDGDPGAAEYNVMRDVDYCSGAAILVRADVFHEVGGFDSRYAPAYYEDTDLAFAVRAAGYRTVVQPKAVVVHHEGVSNGTDINTGVKKHQELNRQAFVEKWADTLAAEHLPEATARNLWLARHRGTQGHFGPLVLVKDHQVPRPDFDSGSVRMFRLLRQLTELGCRVVFFPGNHARLEPYTTDLQQIGVTVLPEPQLQQAFLAEAGSEISIALLSRPQIAWSLLEELRTAAPQCTIAYDTVDVHFLRLERQAEIAESEGRAEVAEALRRKAFASRQMEVGLVRSCDVTVVVSEAEQALLRELVPDSDVRVLSNVHDVDWHSAQPEGRGDVLFVGSFDHPPNADAVAWAARKIMPLVREQCPEAVLHVVGSNPTKEVLRLADDGVEVHGWVADLAPMYEQSRVTLAPLRFGAGVKGKVGESLGAGVPVVGTTVAFEGMHLKAGEDVFVADDEHGLAEAIVRLLGDDDAWARLSAAGKAGVAAQFGPEVSREALAGLLRTADSQA